MCSIQHLQIPRLHEIRLQVPYFPEGSLHVTATGAVPYLYDGTSSNIPRKLYLYFLYRASKFSTVASYYPKYCAAIIWKNLWTFDLIEKDVNVLKKLFRKLSQISPCVFWVNLRVSWFSNYNSYHITKLKMWNTGYRSGTEIFTFLLNKFLATVLKWSSWGCWFSI